MKNIADIIMPGVAGVPALAEIAINALASASNAAPFISEECQILFMDNGGHDQKSRDRVRVVCKELGYRYEFIAEPFNEARYFNLGFEMTKERNAKYVFRANFDVIFYPGWIHNLIESWEKEPDYYCVAPYAFSDQHKGLCYRDVERWENRIMPCDHPSGWMYGMRRADVIPADESFKYWNVDYDFYEWMKANGKKAGVCYSSRVDHLADAVKTHHPESFGFDLNAHRDEADRQFRAKWKLP